jgi:hypothetical protein
VAAFGFNRQIVFNGTHAEYDCIDALKLSQCTPRAVARPGPFNGLCDDEAVLLMCPTCQVSAQSVGDRLLLCMGLFSMFWPVPWRPA